MRLMHVGNKPIISHTGIDFSIGKEDKYVYIEPAAQILDFLGNLDRTKSSTISPNKELDEMEVFDVLNKQRPKYDLFCKQKLIEYEKKLDDEINEVTVLSRLVDVEKEVLKRNLNYMRDYRLQRATNKLVYEELINGCIDIIQKKEIKEVNMPLSLTFVHVAKSFESTLALINRTLIATVDVMLDTAQPYTRFTVKPF